MESEKLVWPLMLQCEKALKAWRFEVVGEEGNEEFLWSKNLLSPATELPDLVSALKNEVRTYFVPGAVQGHSREKTMNSGVHVQGSCQILPPREFTSDWEMASEKAFWITSQ